MVQDGHVCDKWMSQLRNNSTGFGHLGLTQELHRLPVAKRIQNRLCWMVHKSLDGPQVASYTRRSTLVADYLLDLHCVLRRLATLSCHRPVDRAFSVAAPRAWNTLPAELKLLRSTTTFHCQLKTLSLSHSAYGHREDWWFFCDTPSVSSRSQFKWLRAMSRPRFYRAILSHDPIQSKTNKRAQVFLFAGIITYKVKTTLSRDKVADAATVKLHAATLSHEQTQLFTLTAEWRCCRAGVICVPVLGRVVWHRQSAAHCKSAATMKTQSTGRCEISVGPAPNSQSLTTNNDTITSHTMSIKQIKWDFNAGKTAT